MKIKRMNWFVRLITFGWPIAITFAPFGIYVKEKYLDNTKVINHEKIHWQQQIEMLIIPFYLWYIIEWLIKFLFFCLWYIIKWFIEMFNKAYKALSFEREAHNNDFDFNYLDSRKRFIWINNIIRNSK